MLRGIIRALKPGRSITILTGLIVMSHKQFTDYRTRKLIDKLDLRIGIMTDYRERMRDTFHDYEEEKRLQLNEFAADFIKSYESIGLGKVAAEVVEWMHEGANVGVEGNLPAGWGGVEQEGEEMCELKAAAGVNEDWEFPERRE